MNSWSEHHDRQEDDQLWFVAQSAIHWSDKEQSCRHKYKKFYNNYGSAHEADQPRTLVALILPQTDPIVCWLSSKNAANQVMYVSAERRIIQRPIGCIGIGSVFVPIVGVKICRNWKPSSVALEISPPIQFTFILRTLAWEFTIAVSNTTNSRQK